MTEKLVEGEDYYHEGGFIVFTSRYHLRRGKCCGSGCRHCPYQECAGIEDDEKIGDEKFEATT